MKVRFRVGVIRAFMDRVPIDWSALSHRLRPGPDRDLVESLRELNAVRRATPDGNVAPQSSQRSNGLVRLTRAIAVIQIVQSGLWLGVGFAEGAGSGRPIPQIVLACAFAFGGVFVSASVTRDPRTLCLSAWFFAAASAFGRHALTASPAHPTGLFSMLLGGLPVEAFMPAYAWQFAADFPRVQRYASFDRISRWAASGTWLLGSILFAVHATSVLLPGALNGFGWLLRHDESKIFWHLITFSICPAIAAMFARAYRAPALERQKVVRLAAGLAVGTAPFLILSIAGAISPALNQSLVTAGTAGNLWLDAIILGGLAATPLLVAAAMVVDRPFTFRDHPRWPWQYALARIGIDVILIAPFVAVTGAIYNSRQDAVEDVLRHVDGRLWLLCTLAILVAKVARSPLLRAARRFESRRAVEHDAQVVHAISRLRTARGALELSAVLREELQAGTGSGGVNVLLPNDAHAFCDPWGVLAPLPGDAGLVAVLQASAQPQLISASGPLHELFPDRDRHWIDAHGIELVVPIKQPDDALAAIVALRPKRGGMGFDRRDYWLVATIVAAAATGWDANVAVTEASDARHDASGGSRDVAFECPVCGAVAESRLLACGCRAEARLAALPPRIGDLLVIRRLGAGGMGVVYLARDTMLNRDVALKTLPALRPGAVSRLRDEARAMAALNHESLATIYGLLTWRHTPVLSVEYFPHGTLADAIAAHPLPPDAVGPLGASIARGLACMHEAGVLHRDLKPSNIGMTAAGAPKLLDFGLTALWADGGEAGPARLVGTPAYLPPEAFTARAATPLWDLWALAVVLLEASIGTDRMRGSEALKSMAHVADGVPDDLSPACVRPALWTFLSRALAHRPEHRFQSAVEAARALDAIATL